MSCRRTARCRVGIFRNLHFAPTERPPTSQIRARENTGAHSQIPSESWLDGRDVAVGERSRRMAAP